MKKSKFIKNVEYQESERSFEPISDKPSLTIPDQSLSVKDLLERHQRGLSSPVSKEPIYEIDTFGEEINPLRQQNLDFTDIDGLKETINKSMEIVTKLEKEKQKKLKQKEKEEEKQKIIDEYENSKK